MEDVRKTIEELNQKTESERQAFSMMVEMLERLAPEEERPIFSLPVKVDRVNTKVRKIMMLETEVDNKLEYAKKACEFLDRVEEACAAFIEQAKTAGE